MKIVFGHNNYCRKTVQPHELGILTPLEDIKHFELTQRYAHLYWIPFFPIGLSWSARGKDGKLYKLNAGFDQHLKHIRYSWVSGLIAFIGPILLLAGLGIYSANKAYSNYQWKIKYAAIEKKNSEERTAAIMNASTADYYRFTGERDEYAKVVGVNDTAVLLSAAVLELKTNKPAEVVGLLQDSSRNFPPVWVSKKMLIAMINNHSYLELFGLGKFTLQEVQRLGEPLFRPSFSSASLSNSSFSLENRGLDVMVTAIDKMKTNVECDNELPDSCKTDDHLYFNVRFPESKESQEFAFAITCKDKKNKEFKYLIKGKGLPDDEVVIIKQN